MASSMNEGNIYNIEKLDKTKFPLFKEKVFNVLVQKKKAKPVKYEGKMPNTMSREDWEEMDAVMQGPLSCCPFPRLCTTMS